MSEKRKDKKGRLLQANERQRNDGMYEYRYTDGNGTKRSVYSWKLVSTDRIPSGKRGCKLSLREMEEQIQRELITGVDPHASQTLTFNECFEAYMETRKRLQRKTRDGKIKVYEDKLKPRLGSVKIAKLTRNDVMNYYNNLLDKGTSVETLDKVDEVLNQLFENAMANRAINYNPCSGVLAELKHELRYSKKRKHSLTLAEQKAFEKFLSESEKHSYWRPFFKFLLGTGCRIGEALGLTWGDCDFKRGTISINHAIHYYKVGDTDDYGLEITRPKTQAGIREIPMLDAVRELLLEEHERQAHMNLKDIEIDGLSGFIWRTRRGSIPIPGTINAALYSIQKDYNIAEEIASKEEKRDPLFLPKFSVHVLRHTFCTRLCENESNAKVIQEIMGHASIVTTMNVYADATMESRQETFRKLNGIVV